MNEALHVLTTRHSVRSFTPDPVAEADLEQIVAAGQRAPTSMNGQQISVVVVRDAAKRQALCAIARGQPWVAAAPVFLAVVMDFHKTAMGAALAGGQQVIHESVEGLLVGAIDAGLVLGNMLNAAHALGLGAVPIGVIRNDSQAVIDLLSLPPLTYPVVGMALGAIKDDTPLRPRLPLASFRHDEAYSDKAFEGAMRAYDKTLSAYWQQVGRADPEKWTDHMADVYKTVYFPDVKAVLARQGFSADK